MSDSDGASTARPPEDAEGRRARRERVLKIVIEALLALYCIVLALFDHTNLRQAIPPLAALSTVVLVLVAPPRREPSRSRELFVGALVAFLLVNLAALTVLTKLPGAGRLHSKNSHVYEVALALAAGLGVRDRAMARRLLTVILVAFGVRYVLQVVSLPWCEEAFRGGRLQGVGSFATVLAMEFTVLFSLYLGSIAISRGTALALACVLAALLMTGLTLMTKTRFGLLTMVFVTLPAAIVVQKRIGTWRRRLVIALAWVLVVAPAASFCWWCCNPGRHPMGAARGRFEAWEGAVRIAAAGPVPNMLIGYGPFRNVYRAAAAHNGMGPGDFPLHAGGRKQCPDMRFVPVHAHNVVMQRLVETGVLGAGALIMVWAVAFWSSLRAWLWGPEPAASLAGVLVVSLLTIAVMGQMDCLLYWTAGRLSWFITGLAFASGTWLAPPGSVDADPGAGPAEGESLPGEVAAAGAPGAPTIPAPPASP